MAAYARLRQLKSSAQDTKQLRRKHCEEGDRLSNVHEAASDVYESANIDEDGHGMHQRAHF